MSTLVHAATPPQGSAAPAVDPYASINPYAEVFDPNSTDAMSRILRAPKFDLNSIRDPFVSFIDLEGERERELKAITERKQKKMRERFDSRVKEPLEDKDLTALNFVATFRMGDDNVAMVEDSKKQSYIIRVGNYMGKHNGRITKIGQGTMTLTEKRISPAGDIVDSEKVLTLPKK
ncbi:MAG: pilus assembly protein PilP [Mariprofundaceae bacterium]|nr:pilus assembly protein PilP [Mariprofundaceae bacterium]